MPPVTKAVIPAAGLGTRQYPATSCVRKELFPLVDRDGYTKPAIHLAVEEALAAGVEEVCLVCQPDAAGEFRRYFSAMPEQWRARYEDKQWAQEWSARLRRMGERLAFVEQPTQDGLGHAVWCARDWLGREPFLVLLGDHVYVSRTGKSCAAQLIEAFSDASVTALALIPEDQVHGFGLIRSRPADTDARLLRADGFVEKPPIDVARRECRAVGAPDGCYLGHFGMHVFTPGILDVLDEMVRADRRDNGEFQLTTAQDTLCGREPYFGLVIEGARFDIGTPLGLLEAQMALALAGDLRAESERLWSLLSQESEGA